MKGVSNVYLSNSHTRRRPERTRFFLRGDTTENFVPRTAITVASTRRALSKMDAATLNDIGLSAKEARLEAQRSFWDVAPQCAR